MHKIFTKYVLLITTVTIFVVGGTTLIYGALAPDMYLQAQKDTLYSAYYEISSLSAIHDLEINDIIEKYEDDSFRFLVADENFKPVYATDKIEKAHATLEAMKKSDWHYSTEPKIYTKYNRVTKKPSGVDLRARLKFSGKEYYISISESLSAVEKSFEYNNKFLLFLVMIALLVNILLLTIFTRRINIPVKKLSLTAERFKNGDFSARYEGNIPKDEIGELAENFNNMAQKLQESINEVNNYNFLLKQDIKMLSEYESMRKKVVRNITHDLKTPLAIISSQIEMMQVAKTQEKKEEYYASAMEEISKMSLEISNILKASHSPQLEDDYELLDIGEELLELCREFDPYAKAKGIHIHKTIEKGLRAVVNKSHLRQVFDNYMLNAISHIEAGGDIKITLVGQKGDILLSVYNDGPNIPESDLEIIWENFQRGVVKDDPTRTGVGLYIVNEIASMNGDECSATNNEHGVTFSYKIKKAERQGE